MPDDVDGCTLAFEFQNPSTLWMLLLMMWMPLRMPLVLFCSWMPLRRAADDVVLVISRFWIVQYCWLVSRIEAAAPAPAMIGAEPDPYEEMTTGLPDAPEPWGVSSPDQLPPSWNRIWLPAEKVVAFTLARLFQGALVEQPLLESLPELDDT